MFKRPIIAILRFYQRQVSPMSQGSCRFTPVCSEYAIEAVTEWGVIIGLLLALWRILRCNPLCRGGEDPVPLKKRKETHQL